MSAPRNGRGCYPHRCPHGECLMQPLPGVLAEQDHPPEGMFDLERGHPRLMAALYAAVALAALAASYLQPWGVAP